MFSGSNIVLLFLFQFSSRNSIFPFSGKLPFFDLHCSSLKFFPPPRRVDRNDIHQEGEDIGVVVLGRRYLFTD